MEFYSHQYFVEIFKQSVLNKDYETLADILKKGQKFFPVISTEHRESIILSIFDKSTGLLWFLDCELKRHYANRHFYNARTEGFHFLEFFIKNFHTIPYFLHYVHQIKDVCQLALTTKCSYYTQKAACNAFIKLVELFRDHELELVETIENFVHLFHVLDVKERRLIFSLLGKIIKHNEGIHLSEGYLNTIFKQIYSDLLQEYNPNTDGPKDFHIYFDVLSNILDSTDSPDELKEDLFSDLYKTIKNICQLHKCQSIRIVIKSAINFLNCHMNLFRDFVYRDYKYWYSVLCCLSYQKSIYNACGHQALKRFYQIIGEILTEKNDTDCQSIFLYFIEEFMKEFRNTNLNLTTLKLVVYGFGQMAAPCKKYLCQYNVRDMYSIITSCALPLCSSDQNDSTHIENICYYLEALSEMLCHISDVTFEKINVLIKLSIYIIKRFPDLPISNNMLAVSSLIKTIINLGIVNTSLLQRYLENIIGDGIAWSCSHTLSLDVELQRELENIPHLSICYKNYLPLWIGLLNANKYQNCRCDRIVQQIFDILMDVCISFIGRLDIRVKRNEDTVLSDVAFTQRAVNQADFRIFMNLIDLYVDIINVSDHYLFANNVHKFFYEIIKLSYKYPLISGFYKLVQAVMKVSDIDDMQPQTEKLLSNYIADTLDLIPTFSNELLITCLYLVLNTPISYIRKVIPRTIPVFKIAFIMGLGNLELAYSALLALESWKDHLKQELVNEFLCEIIPYLEPYLRSIESSMENSQDLKVERKIVKRVAVIDTACTLRNFQRKILLFLGSVNQDILSNFIHKRSLNTGASWDRKNLLKYTLFFPDIRLDIYFDKILPRIIALATSSSDRRTKIAACEVLHAVIALIVGSTAQHLSDPERYTIFYKTLCPALLILGCDSDEVARGLFQPLTLQLMRWLSSKIMLRSPVIVNVLDALFKGLTEDSNPSLREFSGMCLAEFTRWSIKQAPDERETESNVHFIIQKINNFALHYSKRKRIAAAIAFNHLYTILREDEDIISTYWLKIFYCFIKSLDGCNDLSITNALGHIEKVIKFKGNLLNTNKEGRKKPHEFDGPTVTYALHWLLLHCGALDEHCRIKCMELYINVSQHIGSSAQEMIQSFVKTYGMDQLNFIILKDLELNVKDISIFNTTSLLKTLDFYIWLIERQLMPVEVLFPSTNVEEHTIFSCIRIFIHKFLLITRERTEMNTVTMKSREFEQLITLQCKTFMSLLNFIKILLDSDINLMPESLLDTSLFILCIKCVMYPQAIGFDIKNIEMMDKLPHILDNLLNSMKLKFTEPLLNNFKKCLINFIQEHIPNLLNLHNIADDNSCNKLIQYINGFISLEQCAMLDRSVPEMRILINREDTIIQIFNFLISERMDELICIDLNPYMIDYLQALMKFQLSQHDGSMIQTLLKLIFNDTLVIGVDSTKITHGAHFLNIFKNIIFKYILMHIDCNPLIFDELSRNKPSFLLILIEDLLMFLKQHKRELQAFVDITIDVILKQFAYLECTANTTESQKERFINTYGTAVRLASKPTEIVLIHREFYKWILQQLTDNRNIEYKTRILQNFLICLTDTMDCENPELLAILRTLKTDGLYLCPKLSEMSVSALKVIHCFETLLILLSVTKSIVLLECVIHFATGSANCLFNERLEEYMQRYFNGISSEHILRSLQLTYKMFMNSNTVENERMDILQRFLLLMFKLCNTCEIERFFEKNIKELYMISQQNIVNDSTDVKQVIVSKIGCYQMIAIMFVKLDLTKIVSVNSIIARTAVDKIETGRELYQSLFNSVKSTRALKISRLDCKELLRILHCSAYNCSLTLVSLKEEELFYSTVFAENRAQSILIWENIIDCTKQYALSQTFKEYPKTRETAVNIKSFNKDEHQYSYIHSYDLCASTLNEDINAYDLNRCVLLPKSGSDIYQQDMMTIPLESDDLNNHECMPYICGILTHISLRKISVPRSNEMPKWLQLFQSGMLTYNYPNIRLFMLKIVTNTAETVFKPYANFILTPIIKTISQYLKTYDLNYIITDVLEILMDWHDVAIPNNETGRVEAQILFEVIVDKVLIEKYQISNKRVYNYNISLMKTMIENWNNCLKVPKCLDKKMISAPTATMNLILSLLSHDMANEILNRNDIIDFLLKPLRDWNTDEEMPLQCCECLGLYLKYLGRNDETDNKRREVKEKIFAILGAMKEYKYVIKQMKRIVFICRTYPEIATDYINIVISATSVTKNLGRSYCLEIFLLSIPKLSMEDIKSNLYRMELQAVLKDRVSSCNEIGLQIIQSIIMIISPTDLLPYVNLVIPYIKSDFSEYRRLAYNIFISVYKKYSIDIADDATVTTLLSISIQNLLIGLLDSSHDLQEKILKFWAEDTKLTEKARDRLIAILDMHSPEMEDIFSPFIALLMLHLVSKSVDYTKKMFEPLYNCIFKDYKIAVSWRTRNLSFLTPMFIDSLASQINYTFSQSIVNNYKTVISSQRSNIPWELCATQELEFEPTLVDDMTADRSTFDNSLLDIEINHIISSKQLQLTHKKKSKRFLANSTDVANIIRQKNIQKNMQRAKLIKQENIRQRSSVKLYRNYRIGDFPDIEISHSNLIEPLLQLIKLDDLICKDMIVSLFSSLINEIIEREGFSGCYQTIIQNLKRILHSSKKNSSFNAAILETFLMLNITGYDQRDIVKVSKTNGLNILGILLLERNLLPDAQNELSSSPNKKMRYEYNTIEETDKWVQLASLYKSLSNVDIVLSIFQGQSFSEDIQQAALAEAYGDWIQAKNAYERAYNTIKIPSIKEHCLQGLFEGINNLCDWSEIDKLVKNKVNGNLKNIWNDAWKDWMIPWVCDAYVYMLLDGNWVTMNNDLEIMQSWIDDQTKLDYIKPIIGEDLVMFLLKSQNKAAPDLLKDILDEMIKQWVRLNTLSTELGIQQLQRLQLMNDLSALLGILQCDTTDYLNKMPALLKLWTAKVPSLQDSLTQWNKLAAYRTYSSMLLEDTLCNMQENEVENYENKNIFTNELRRHGFQLRLDIIEAALHQKHRYIANKHLRYLKGIYCPHDLKPRLTLVEAKTKYLYANIEADISEKMSNYTFSWKCSHQLLNEDILDSETNTAVRKHIGIMAAKIELLSKENEEFAQMLINNRVILDDIRAHSNDLNNIKKLLLQYSLKNLKTCCDAATVSIGEHFYTLARHCYARLTSSENDEIFQEFTLSTLRSMYHGYFEATHYFPCLLKAERLQNEKIQEIFVAESAKLPPWLFLRWQDMLFSYLGTSIAETVIPIVERMVEAYPNAVDYTYYLAIERNPTIFNDRKTQRIHSLLHNKMEEIKHFLMGIQYVAQPELFLKYYLNQAMKDLSQGKTMILEPLLKKVYPPVMAAEKNPRPGNIYSVIAKYENMIRLLDPNNHEAIRNSIRGIKELLDKSILKRPNKNRLKDYSPFLHEYVGGNIEIPGQYTGNKEPIPRYHAKIMRIEPVVSVMQSLHKPIRITMIGDNGKEYKFLVKFGEDLTIDHGLQQLYTTMNRALQNDAICRQKRLAVDTYQVIPLSKSFGLIQWVEETRSLEDLISFTLSRAQRDCHETIRKEYMAWIANATPSKRIADQYKEATRYNQLEVTAKMKYFISETKQNALRETFTMMSPSPESFITLRRNFVTSYATMCIAHWIAGIGDRHLQNTLVVVESGRCLGIDFGNAFGAGIRALVPELVPFRLTPQILELLQPFTDKDLFGTIMTHIMRVLRDDKGPILACMDIFIYEPVNRALSINDEEICHDTEDPTNLDLTWSSNKDIEIIAKKLHGIHPSFITLEQLKETHNDKYFKRYHAIVSGNDERKEARANFKYNNLTPAEQVDCLLDQAKDLNILGRIYANWQPWL